METEVTEVSLSARNYFLNNRQDQLATLVGRKHSDYHHQGPRVENETSWGRTRLTSRGSHSQQDRPSKNHRFLGSSTSRFLSSAALRLFHLESVFIIHPAPQGGDNPVSVPIFSILSGWLSDPPIPTSKISIIFSFLLLSGIISKNIPPDPSVLSNQEPLRTDSNAPKQGSANIFLASIRSRTSSRSVGEFSKTGTLIWC